MTFMFKKKTTKNKVVVVKDRNTSDSFAKNKAIPKTAQDVIPYDEIYDNGVYRKDNTFSLMFKWQNINYKTKKENEKDITYEKYQSFLSSLPANIRYQEYIANRPFNEKDLREAMIPTDYGNIKTETLTDYQKVMENIVKDCTENSCNQIVIGAISFTPQNKLDDVNILFKYFNQIEIYASDMGSKVKLITTVESLEILHSIYHPFDNEPFLLPENYMQHDVKLKDYIAPAHFTFKSKLIEIGNSYSCVMFIKHISKSCDDELITDLLDNTYNVAVSKHLLKIDKSESLAILKRHMQDLEGRMEKRREINAKRGGQFIPYSLRSREKELTELQEKLGETNCDMYSFATYIMLSARTENELTDLISYVKQKALEHQVKVDILSGNKFQMLGLNCVLPFANPVISSDGELLGQPFYLPTDEVANFIPFSYRNIFSKGGLYYGINKVTSSPIIIDKRENMNSNSFILGTSGSGKSMDVKSELYAAMMKYPNDEFFIIDPENEYSPLVEEFNGEIIKLSPNSKNHLNIMDTDLSYEDDGTSAVTMKSDFIMTFIESAKGRALTANEKTILDRVVNKVYSKYQLSTEKETITLKHLYDEILACPEQEAKDIALILELYVKGSYDIFAYPTNVSYHKKFIVYDIFELGKQLEKVGLLVILELLWQRVIENKKRGIRTWVYTDEFSIMFRDNNQGNEVFSTGDFFVKVYKRIRKHGGTAGGATQNITEVMASPQALTMLSNSDFVMLLRQQKSDLKRIVEYWDLSESQAKHLDGDEVGTGLIISGSSVIPFQNIIPADSRMYKLCTTKFTDIQNNLGKGKKQYECTNYG